MSNQSFDFGLCFNQALEVYKQHFVVLLGVSVVTSILMVVSFGILAGPLLAGVMTMMLQLVDQKEEAGFEGVFRRFDLFLPTGMLCLSVGLTALVAMKILLGLSVFGQLLLALLGFGLSAFLIFSILLVVEEGLDFQAAAFGAYALLKRDFWPLIGLTAVAVVLGGLGFFVRKVGVVFTLPIFYLMMASAFRRCSAEREPVVSPLDEEPMASDADYI